METCFVRHVNSWYVVPIVLFISISNLYTIKDCILFLPYSATNKRIICFGCARLSQLYLSNFSIQKSGFAKSLCSKMPIKILVRSDNSIIYFCCMFSESTTLCILQGMLCYYGLLLDVFGDILQPYLCQFCRHWWHRKLSLWRTIVPPMMTKLASWQLSDFSDVQLGIMTTYGL